MNSHPYLALLLSGSFIAPLLGGTITIGTAPPAVNGADIAQLSGSADAGGDQGHLWSNRPHQGQSFTTGSDPSGYFLISVTMRNLNNTITTAPTFNLQIGTLSDTGSPETFTQVGTAESGVSPNYVPLDYITFTFDTPIELDPNTRYAFLWGTNGSGFVTVNNLDDNSYSGGTALSSGDDNVLDPANVILQNVDRVFHLDLEVVDSFDRDKDGLPSQWEIDNGLDPDDNGENPNNNGVAGDPDNGPAGDPDMDGLDNLGELNRGSDPQDDDTDDDSLSDLVETKTGIFIDENDTGSDPALADTDGDMIDDNDEVEANPHVTDPNNTDTDSDGISDFDELQADPYVTNPTLLDTDEDGFDDILELSNGSDPTDPSSFPSLGPMFVSKVPPPVDGADIAQLGGIIDIGGDLGHAWSNRPRQGQSFTTGTDSGGYTLNAITVRAQVNQVSTTSPDWELRVGSLDETGIFTPLVTETIIGALIPNGTRNWVTWRLSAPLQLDPNTAYAFDVFPSGNGYISLGESTDVLPGGSAYSAGSPGSTIYPASPPDPITTHGNDRAFHLNLEASGGSGLEFTEIVIVDTPGGDAVRLTWNSSPGRTYALDASPDLVDWSGEVDDGILSNGETTTYETLISNLPVAGSKIFFRLRLE